MSEELQYQMTKEINKLIESRSLDVADMYPKVRDAYLNPYN